jgi:hypothetical protein
MEDLRVRKEINLASLVHNITNATDLNDIKFIKSITQVCGTRYQNGDSAIIELFRKFSEIVVDTKDNYNKHYLVSLSDAFERSTNTRYRMMGATAMALALDKVFGSINDAREWYIRAEERGCDRSLLRLFTLECDEGFYEEAYKHGRRYIKLQESKTQLFVYEKMIKCCQELSYTEEAAQYAEAINTISQVIGGSKKRKISIKEESEKESRKKDGNEKCLYVSLDYGACRNNPLKDEEYCWKHRRSSKRIKKEN